jgi:hypothetical protein
VNAIRAGVSLLPAVRRAHVDVIAGEQVVA